MQPRAGGRVLLTSIARIAFVIRLRSFSSPSVITKVGVWMDLENEFQAGATASLASIQRVASRRLFHYPTIR